MSCRHASWEAIEDTLGGDYRRCVSCGLEEQASLSDVELRFVEAQDEWYGADDPACLTPFALALSAHDAEYRTAILRSVASGAGRLLEVGPGSGQFAESARSAGYDVVAIEDSPVLVEACRSRGVEVERGTFETVELDPESFDVIVTWHVIEHVTEPVEFLRQAALVARPGALLVVGTPNARSWQHRWSGRLSPNYSRAHLRLFTDDSLGDVLHQAGWEVQDAFTTDEPEHWMKVMASFARAGAKRLSRYTANAPVDDAQPSDTQPLPLAVETISAERGMLATRVFGVCTAPLRRLQVLRGRGNEVIVIGRRSTSIPTP